MTDGWRDHDHNSLIQNMPFGKDYADEADEWAEKNLPGWVEITEDESTHPPYGVFCMRHKSNLNRPAMFYPYSKEYVLNAYIGIWWRPLGPNDRPPVEGK